MDVDQKSHANSPIKLRVLNRWYKSRGALLLLLLVLDTKVGLNARLLFWLLLLLLLLMVAAQHGNSSAHHACQHSLSLSVTGCYWSPDTDSGHL